MGRKIIRKANLVLILALVLSITVACSDAGKPGIEGSTQNPTTLAADNTANPQPSPTEQPQNTTPPKKDFTGIKAKAVYLTGTIAGIGEKLDHFIDLANTTEINAVVIDIKENGNVNYESKVPEVIEHKTFVKSYNPEEVLKKLHDNNIYVIGRIVCFKDNKLAEKRPDMAIKQPNGSLWRENGKTAWTNPYNEDVWNYNIEIAKEAVDLGFDEIQFDYVRFPSAKKSSVDYGTNPPPKSDAISNFLSKASKELRDGKGVVVSADVFGIIIESNSDGEAIGQVLERVGLDVDYICPMVYPSHYANASNGTMGNGVGQKINGVSFTAPDLKPYEVVYNSLLKCNDGISKVPGYKAKVRAYLQDFTATYLPQAYRQEYGIKQVQDQIKAVYDAGYEEWILWDGWNTYTEGALLKE